VLKSTLSLASIVPTRFLFTYGAKASVHGLLWCVTVWLGRWPVPFPVSPSPWSASSIVFITGPPLHFCHVAIDLKFFRVHAVALRSLLIGLIFLFRRLPAMRLQSLRLIP
jgi:hypothetical protein